MKKSFTLVILLHFMMVGVASGQIPVRYEISLDHIRQHEVFVTVEFAALPLQPLEIIMPSASPGRYAVHHFAKNVFGEKAFDEHGHVLSVQKADIDRWLGRMGSTA